MLQTFIYIFSLIMLFILIRESVIDIKTMYVPDNITFSAYTTAILYLISITLLTRSLSQLKTGFLGFLFGFGLPFAISFFAYIIQLVSYKQSKRRNNNKTSIPSENTNIAKDNNELKLKKASKIMTIRKYLYWSLLLIFGIFISINQNYTPKAYCIIITIVSILMAYVVYEKYKEISYPLYIISGALITISCIYHKNMWSIFYVIIAICAELLLSKLFGRFYKIDEDTSAENNDTDENISGGIGGGDILIFGALGLMFGIKGIIIIFIYSVICQLFVIMSYYMLSFSFSITGEAPFVPGITLGLFLFINNFDFLNIQNILTFFSGGAL